MSALVTCPDCRRRVRPCNLERHRNTHFPVVEHQVTNGYRWTKIGPAKRPLRQYRNHDRRYDEIYPRGEGPYRFRIYRLRATLLEPIGAAPDPPGYGVATFEMNEDGQFLPDDATGILDTVTDPGDWIIDPFAIGRTPHVE